jgi:hypothetical protein
MQRLTPPTYGRRLVTYAAVVAVSFATVSLAQQAATPSPPAINVLDGKTFTGEIVPVGKASGRAEDFVFADGKFRSKVCLHWGFKPGPYWVRMENGQVHFRARLTSVENGVMTFRGDVAGSRIYAEVDWVKPRWYWTIERQFRFQGDESKDAAKGGS